MKAAANKRFIRKTCTVPDPTAALQLDLCVKLSVILDDLLTNIDNLSESKI